MNFNNTIEIILPKEDNQKIAIDWKATLDKVGRAFGGYTFFTNGIFGVWFDGLTEYKDDNNVLRLDYAEYSQTIEQGLIDTLNDLFKTQLSVYVRVNNKTAFLEKSEIPKLTEYLKSI